MVLNIFGTRMESIIEADYELDTPIGVAREWNANGNLAKEITYKKGTDQFEIKNWDNQGRLIHKAEARNADYFDKLTIKTTSLTDSIERIVSIACQYSAFDKYC